MWIHDSGTDYYLDQAAFQSAMSAPPPPLDMAEVIAIQHRMREMETEFMARMEQISSPDPEAELRRYLDQLIEKEPRGLMAVNLGEQLDPGQRVDALAQLSGEQVQRLLVQHVVDSQPPAPGIVWDGHVEFHFRTDTPIMSATVYVWKREAKDG